MTASFQRVLTWEQVCLSVPVVFIIILFLVPHLVSTQRAYKDIRIHLSDHMHTHTRMHTHTHTHTFYKCMHYWWWIGRMRRQNNRSVCVREEMGFQFWLKRREWRQIHHKESVLLAQPRLPLSSLAFSILHSIHQVHSCKRISVKI